MIIVVGYVPRPEGDAALKRAIAEARSRGARLLVVNTSRGDAAIDTAYADDDEIRALDQLLTDSGVDHELRHVARGNDASEEVIRAAAETAADMIIIGLRRRTNVGKFILGSTAQEILFEAPCPVLTVKADVS